MPIERILETCLYAENLEETAAFYAEVLGLTPFARVDLRHVFFRCGRSVLLLFNPAQTSRPTGEVPAHGAFGPGHVAFAMASGEIAAWRNQLQARGVAIEAEIAWPHGGHSIYFRDPAGNSVELTTPETWGLPGETPYTLAGYRSVLNLLPIAVCVVIPETGEILLANHTAAGVLDIENAQSLVGRSVLDFIQPHRRAEVHDYLHHVAQAMPAPEFFHERLELANDQLIDLEIAAGALDLAGRTVIQLAFRDITDRTLAEAALRQSEALFRQLAETTDAAIFLYRGTQNLYVNTAACTITGYTYDELLAMPFWQVLHPDFREQIKQRGLARQSGQTIEPSYEVAVLTRSGETRWLQYAGNLIEYQGKPAVLGTAIDITARKEIEQALRESEARFRTLADVSPASISVHVDDQVIYSNAATTRLTGWTQEQLKTVDFWSMLHPQSVEIMQRAYAQMNRDVSVSNLELQIVLQDGTTKWVDVSWSHFDLRARPALVITAYDITALVEAERALRSHAQRLELLSEIDHLGLMSLSRHEIAARALDHIRKLVPCDRASIVEVDARTRSHAVLAVSPSRGTQIRAGRRFKLEQWQVVHQSLARGLHYVPDLDALPSLTPLQAEIRSEGLRSYASVPLAAQDKLMGVLNLGSFEPDAFGDDRQTGMLEVARRLAVVMYNAQLFGELEANHRRLEELSSRLVRVQEAERRYIARELHDEVGQTLTALNIHLEIAQRARSEERPDRLAEAQRLVEDLADRVRRMSLDMRPPMLDDLGLLPTLLWYFERVAQQYQLHVVFEHQGIERRFDADVETALYRVVQEALTNVARHAQVQTATVRLWADSATISAQIEDKGQGFDLDLVLGLDNSIGLRGMRERVRLLGGQMVIEAQPGGGVCVTALLPLKKARRP